MLLLLWFGLKGLLMFELYGTGMKTQQLEEEEGHIHSYTEYNQQWNVCSAFNPSKSTHTRWFLWFTRTFHRRNGFLLYKLYVLLPYTYHTPKLSPHRRRCISIFPQKTHSVWFISVLNYGDTDKSPHKSPSPCNTYVIPMLLYKFVLINHIHAHTPHARTHARTHPLTRHLWCSQSDLPPPCIEVRLLWFWRSSSSSMSSFVQ